ncbi:MAG: LysM peptidoglycan-binding domain-containing protein, partial [Candidatus Portnoybacteria bacterium]
MKAITAVKTIVVVVMVLLLSSAVMAETTENYSVKRGDSLWRIGNKFQVKWEKIAQANDIKPPYIIHPNQVLIMPERQWENVGGNPYKGTFQWAISNFYLPDEIKVQVIENIKNKNFKWLKSGLQSGQELEQVTFGRNQIWNDVLTVFPDEKAYAARDYSLGEYHVIQVLECNNWAWWKEEKKESELPPVPVFAGVKREEEKSEKLLPEISTFPPVPIFSEKEEASFPLVPVFNSSAKEKEKICDNCGFDFYIGGGIYETDRWFNSNNKNYYASGFYIWGKARYRPFGFDVSKTVSACLGGFVFGALGEGDDQDYDYSWKKWLIGPSLKLMGPHWDADFDLGWGKLISEGRENLYESEQLDDIYSFSSHLNLYQRKDRG